MTSLYFLDGLGSNRYYISRLANALAEKAIELIYLPLPGHPDNRKLTIETLEDLHQWFEAQVVEEKAVVMGYSLGADFATYLAEVSSKIEKLILLDGGFWNLDAYPLSQELEDSRAYIASQTASDLQQVITEEAASPFWGNDLESAVRYAYELVDGQYQLALQTDTVLKLLTLRRDCLGILAQESFSTPTLLVLSGQPATVLDQKKALISTIRRENLRVSYLLQASHQLYLEYPKEIAEQVKTFLTP